MQEIISNLRSKNNLSDTSLDFIDAPYLFYKSNTLLKQTLTKEEKFKSKNIRFLLYALISNFFIILSSALAFVPIIIFIYYAFIYQN